jgi:MFS family permease
MMIRSPVRLSILLLFLVSGISIISLPASANPVMIDLSLELSLWALIMLAANFPVNLFWYLLAMRIDAKRWGMKMGDIPRDTETFVSLVLFAVFMVTLAGAAIDLIFIVPSFSNYSGVNIPSISIGMLLIFASVVFASMMVLRMKTNPSIVAGAVLAGVNPLFWGFIRMSGWNQIFLLIPVLFLILAVIAFFLLSSWHKKAMSKTPTDNSEMSLENEKNHRMRARMDGIISVFVLLIILLPIITNALTHLQPYIGYIPYTYEILWIGIIIAICGIFIFSIAKDRKQYLIGWIVFSVGIILMVIDIIGCLNFNMIHFGRYF